MSTANAALEQALREATSPDRSAPLLRALGIGPYRSPDTRGAGRFGPIEDAEVGDLVDIGARGRLTVLWGTLERRATTQRIGRITGRVRTLHPARLFLFLLDDLHRARLVLSSHGLDGRPRILSVDRDRPRRTDIETLEEMAARPGEAGVRLALRHARALDRSRVTRRFFRDFKVRRERIAAAWTGVPPSLAAERDQLALLLLCRLMFLYFIQRQGQLAGDRRFIPHLLRRPGSGEDRSLYRSLLRPLLFEALNTKPAVRPAAARALGPLPYLNGGLFEKHALERRYPALDLPDSVVRETIDGFLERYRFTASEGSDPAPEGVDEAGIDPEMLGRVFEELMADERRGATGTFYTPATVVDRLVRDALIEHLEARTKLTRPQAEALVRHGRVPEMTRARRAAIADIVAKLTVLDPACGSGAFLLGALFRLTRIRRALGGAGGGGRRSIVGRTLYGVDLQDDAALLCALRLWLALTAGEAAAGGSMAVGESASPPYPLPNLDRHIRQGDSLVDPLDLAAAPDPGAPWRRAQSDAPVRAARDTLNRVADRYRSADPEERRELRRTLGRVERRLARAWIDALERQIHGRIDELRVVAETRDLFGDVPSEARRALRARTLLEHRKSELVELRRVLDDHDALPFFSYGVHFAAPATRGFDLVLSNPPWVRAHRWPRSVRERVRQRYGVCRDAGWRAGAELTGAPAGVAGQVDLSLLFLERSLQLAAPDGTIAMLLPAKFLRSLYGAGARRFLDQGARLASIEDHSLNAGAIFRRGAFAAAIIARKVAGSTPRDGAGDARHEPTATEGEPAGERRNDPSAVRVTMTRRGRGPIRFRAPRRELPLHPDDPASPLLLAPPDVRRAVRRMQSSGTVLGRSVAGIRRGVMTGANDVLVITDAEAKLGGLTRIRAEGHHRAPGGEGSDPGRSRYADVIETGALRPLVRGRGIGAWRFRVEDHVVFTHDDESGEPRPPPRRTARYLDRHAERLRARSGWRPGMPLGRLSRLSAATLGPKVAWRDLAGTLEAVAIPARIAGPGGRATPVVPLNTVYFIPVRSEGEALLLAALFNSLPARTFVRAIAQRAKDARFRFLGWTVALLPVPDGWNGPISDRVLRIARDAHRRGELAGEDARALDAIVANQYGLTAAQRRALEGFDRWLRGAEPS